MVMSIGLRATFLSMFINGISGIQGNVLSDFLWSVLIPLLHKTNSIKNPKECVYHWFGIINTIFRGQI